MNIGALNAPCLFLLLGAAAFFTGCGSFIYTSDREYLGQMKIKDEI